MASLLQNIPSTLKFDGHEANLAGSANGSWAEMAIARIEADQRRSADTHLHKIEVPALDGIGLYLKDESAHPTGSLKHRLARSLFLYALCNGQIRSDTPIVEASSGSTAVSEAYFARMIGLPFYAVMRRSTSSEKIAAIKHYGGQCHFVEDGRFLYEEASALAVRLGGHYLDQFAYAERATDWRGNNNIAESIFEQMELEEHPVPMATRSSEVAPLVISQAASKGLGAPVSNLHSSPVSWIE